MRTPEEIEAKAAEGWPWCELPKLAEDTLGGYVREAVLRGIERAAGHKPAWRGVDLCKAWAWLHQDDEWLDYLNDETNYPLYGAPKLRDACNRLNIEWPTEDRGLNRMAEGLPCWDGCWHCVEWVKASELDAANARIKELEARVAELESKEAR